MKLHHYFKHVLALTFAAAMVATAPAEASTAQVYVGKTGASDTGGCGASYTAAPCLTLTYALTQVAAKGVIIIKESGIYDPVTIAQFVSIIGGDGVNAFIYATGTSPAVTVNNASTDDLRFINIVVAAPADTNSTVGIQINSGRRVELSAVSLRGFTQNAIYAPSTTPLDLMMKNLTVSGHSSHCIYLRPTGSGIVRFILRDSRIDHCGGAGIRADATGTSGIPKNGTAVNGSIIGSSVFSITSSCVSAVSGTSDTTNGVASVLVNDTVMQSAGTGVTANGPNAFIHLKSASIIFTNTAVYASNNGVISYMDSMIDANGTPGTATTEFSLK